MVTLGESGTGLQAIRRPCSIWVCTRLGWGRACRHPGWLVCCMYNAALIKTISSSFSSGGNSCLGPERSNKFRATAQTTSLSQQLGEMRRKEPEGLLRYLILFLRYPITLDSIARQGWVESLMFVFRRLVSTNERPLLLLFFRFFVLTRCYSVVIQAVFPSDLSPLSIQQ